MCFSATASFGAGVVLTGIGMASLKISSPSQRMVASIPLLFGVQQITEGFLWLSLSNPYFSVLENGSTWLFLFFAQVLWPAWVPLAVLKAETKPARKKWLWIIAIGGLTVAAYMLFCLVMFPVTGRIDGLHIAYEQDYPQEFRVSGGLVYLAATILPPFFSSIKRMWVVGAAILLSYLVTYFFYTGYIVSVWCFFAAIISASVLDVLRRQAGVNIFRTIGYQKNSQDHSAT